MTQKEKVERHLMRLVAITPLEALRDYGCFRLAAIIHKLRQQGWDIETRYVTTPDGEKKFASYKLNKLPS